MRGHVRERSPGHWAIVIDVRDPATGKRRRKWHSFRGTKKQAQDERTRLLAELNSGSYVEPSKATFAQFLDRWLDDVRSRVTPKTHERYAQICQKNIGPLLGAITLGKLKSEQISEAYAKALTIGRSKGDGGLSPRTVRQMHAIVKSSLAQAVVWGILARNPAAVVKGAKAEPRRHADLRSRSDGRNDQGCPWRSRVHACHAGGALRAAEERDRCAQVAKC
jgi:hypothetical protein